LERQLTKVPLAGEAPEVIAGAAEGFGIMREERGVDIWVEEVTRGEEKREDVLYRK
jgi:hypothetical protein